MRKGEKIPPFKQKSREAARAILANRELEDQYSALLGLPEDASQFDEREQEVHMVSDMRIKAAERYADVQLEIESLEKGDPQLKELKKSRRSINAEINEMPPAGSTFSEWEALSEEERSAGPGRPPVPIEIKLVRSRIDRDEAMADLRKVEKDEGREKSSEKQILEYYEEATKNTGRTPIDPLGALDREIRKIQSELALIEDGTAEKEYKKKVKSAMVSDQGKRYGRPPETPKAKKKRLTARLESLQKRVKAMEDTLSPVERMERELKLHRDELFYLRKAIRLRGVDPKGDISGEPEAVAISDVLKRIDTIKATIETMKKGGDASEVMAAMRARSVADARRKYESEPGAGKKKEVGEDLDSLAQDLGVG